MSDDKVALTKETQRRLIALSKSLGVDAKTELAPEWKKIYNEDYIQARVESHGEEAAQQMAVEVLTARYYQQVLRSDADFIFQVKHSGTVQISEKKDQYITMSGWSVRLDKDGTPVDSQPLAARMMIKGEDNINKFTAITDGDVIRASCGVMNKNNYYNMLFRAPENLDPVQHDQERVIEPEEEQPYAIKTIPLINISRVWDYEGDVVAIWGKPVLRATVGKTKNVGVYEIIDDSIDKAFLLQYKALTIFTDRKYIDCGPGSHVLFIIEILKPRKKGQLPNANMLMHFPGDMVTPVMKVEEPKRVPEATPEEVSDEELEETGLDVL